MAEAATIGPQAWGPDTVPNEVNAFLAIDPDGSILIRSPHQEMGQGAITALPMIVAEELECDWSKVKVEHASASRNLRDHNVYGDMVTAGSRGVRTSWQMLLQAGASARERLIAAAARRWKVPTAECAAVNSKVVHKASGRSLDYGALAAEAGAIKLDKEPAIRTPDKFKLIGKSVPRARHAAQDQRHRPIRHRYAAAGHGLCGDLRLFGVRRQAQKRGRCAGRRPARHRASGQAR